MLYHNKPITTVLKELSTDAEKGLTSIEAGKRMSEYGQNKLSEKKKKTNFQRFCDQFKDVMILILIAAAVISFGIVCVEGEPVEFFFEPILILLIVVLNAFMGMMQESKAEKALEALKDMSAPPCKSAAQWRRESHRCI